MTSSDYWNNLLLQVEAEASNISYKKIVSFEFYQKVEDTLNSCLITRDYSQLFDFLDYFEHREKYPNILHSADTRRIYVTILFLKYELNEKSEVFLSSVSSYQEFLQQYVSTIFALRRMELQSSTELMYEASAYVQSIPLSVYAARGIIENEYFENRVNIYWNLYQAKKSQWDLKERSILLYQLLEYGDSLRAYLELSSICMENRDYKQAYNILSKIPNPTPQIIDLMSTLKGVLPNE